MARHRHATLAAIAGIAVVAGSGCSVGGEADATSIEADDVPFDLLDPHAPAIARVENGRTVSVCMLRDDRLEPLDREVERGADLREVLASLAATSDAEAAQGYQSAITDGEEIEDVEVQSGIATVDLAQGADQTFTPDPIATIAQIVCTLTRQGEIDGVQFAVDGQLIDVPRDDGSLTDEPVGAADYQTLLAGG